jgi:hypothetical protein
MYLYVRVWSEIKASTRHSAPLLSATLKPFRKLLTNTTCSIAESFWGEEFNGAISQLLRLTLSPGWDKSDV